MQALPGARRATCVTVRLRIKACAVLTHVHGPGVGRRGS